MDKNSYQRPNHQQAYSLLSLKIVLTLCFTLIVAFSPNSLTKEVNALGINNAIIIVVAFFILVVLYCRTLQKTLCLISPHQRKCTPKSVWLMFLIPYNFIEDFLLFTIFLYLLKTKR